MESSSKDTTGGESLDEQPTIGEMADEYLTVL